MLALVVAALLFGSASSRAAAPRVAIAVTASPQALHYPDRLHFTLAVNITTGAYASSVFLNRSGPAWPDPNVIGSPIEYGVPSLQGPGHLGFIAASAVPRPGPQCRRGGFDVSGGAGGGWVVDLPAQTTTTLMVPARAMGKPWPGTNYTPELTQSHFEYDAHDVGPLARPAAVPVPGITMSGSRGVHITLTTRPRPTRTGLLNANHKVGRRLKILGRTSPKVRNAPIKLRARFLGPLKPVGQRTRLIKLGTVRTDAQGRFRRSWKPGHAGTYQLLARYDQPVAPLLRDRSCNVRFTTTR